MKDSLLFILLLSCILTSYGSLWQKKATGYKIKNFSLEKCSDTPQPLLLENVTVETTKDGDLAVSGTMSSLVNLDSPIKVSVYMKRKILGLWVKVICINKLGSCTYPDVCRYGIEENTPCPEKLEKNKIPCRCPIKQGNYTIPNELIISKEYYQESIISGRYTAQIIVQDSTTQLGCYNTKFVLY